jgi:hypothetical protein
MPDLITMLLTSYGFIKAAPVTPPPGSTTATGITSARIVGVTGDEQRYLDQHEKILRPGAADRTLDMFNGAIAVYRAMPTLLKLLMLVLLLCFFVLVLPVLLNMAGGVLDSKLSMAKIMMLLLFVGALLLGRIMIHV